MLEIVTIPSVLVLGLVLLLPILLIAQINRWTNEIAASSRLLLPHLPSPCRQRPKDSSEVVSLRMYPIKSCRGFEVQQTLLKEHGLDLDRRWMLVDATTHEFLTMRQIPAMTLIGTGLSADGEELVVSIPALPMSSTAAITTEAADEDHLLETIIRIPSHPSPQWLENNTTTTPVRIWRNDTDGCVYSDIINSTFSAFLGRAVALVYKGPTPRVLKGNGAPTILGRVQTTGFPDVFPVLIASEASLIELNKRLCNIPTDPITMERFRPNIIVKGQTAWSEDSWKTVRIWPNANEKNCEGKSKDNRAGSRCSSGNHQVHGGGSVVVTPPLDLDIVARCARCQVPNVDPDTGRKHRKQPWDTLMSYRRVDKGIKYKPCFGMLSAPRNEGLIEVGMKLEVLEYTTEHRYITGF